MSITLTCQELYDRVWVEPVDTLAKEFGVTAVSQSGAVTATVLRDHEPHGRGDRPRRVYRCRLRVRRRRNCRRALCCSMHRCPGRLRPESRGRGYPRSDRLAHGGSRKREATGASWCRLRSSTNTDGCRSGRNSLIQTGASACDERGERHGPKRKSTSERLLGRRRGRPGGAVQDDAK